MPPMPESSPVANLSINAERFPSMPQSSSMPFKHTKIFSTWGISQYVALLDCCTIAWVVILTWVVLGTRYSLWQFFCAAICVVGLGLVFISDAGVRGGGGSKPLLGDLLVIAATLLYAVSNVSEEFCSKNKERVELLSMIGLFGTLVCACEIAVLERKSLESVQLSAKIILIFAGYALSSFMFYTLLPFVMKTSGATMFNLSLLTSDMWAVVIRIFFYRQQVDWLYYLSFAVVLVGLVIYSKPYERDGNLTAQCEMVGEETAESGNETIAAL